MQAGECLLNIATLTLLMDYVVLAIGLAAMIQGLPYAMSPKLARKKIRQWLKSDDLTFRTYGAFALGIGLGIVCIGLF